MSQPTLCKPGLVTLPNMAAPGDGRCVLFTRTGSVAIAGFNLGLESLLAPLPAPPHGFLDAVALNREKFQNGLRRLVFGLGQETAHYRGIPQDRDVTHFTYDLRITNALANEVSALLFIRGVSCEDSPSSREKTMADVEAKCALLRYLTPDAIHLSPLTTAEMAGHLDVCASTRAIGDLRRAQIFSERFSLTAPPDSEPRGTDGLPLFDEVVHSSGFYPGWRQWPVTPHEGAMTIQAIANSPEAVTVSFRFRPTNLTGAEVAAIELALNELQPGCLEADNPPRAQVRESLARLFDAETLYWTSVQVAAETDMECQRISEALITEHTIPEWESPFHASTDGPPRGISRVLALTDQDRKIAVRNLSDLETYPWGALNGDLARDAFALEGPQGGMEFTTVPYHAELLRPLHRMSRDVHRVPGFCRLRSLLHFPEMATLWRLPTPGPATPQERALLHPSPDFPAASYA